FTSFVERLGFHVPDYLSTSYPEAKKAFENGSENKELLNAWTTAPHIGGLRFILDLPALLINICITALVFVGIKESKNFNNILVVLKIAVIMLILGVGFAYVNAENWTPLRSEERRVGNVGRCMSGAMPEMYLRCV